MYSWSKVKSSHARLGDSEIQRLNPRKEHSCGVCRSCIPLKRRSSEGKRMSRLPQPHRYFCDCFQGKTTRNRKERVRQPHRYFPTVVSCLSFGAGFRGNSRRSGQLPRILPVPSSDPDALCPAQAERPSGRAPVPFPGLPSSWSLVRHARVQDPRLWSLFSAPRDKGRGYRELLAAQKATRGGPSLKPLSKPAKATRADAWAEWAKSIAFSWGISASSDPPGGPKSRFWQTSQPLSDNKNKLFLTRRTKNSAWLPPVSSAHQKSNKKARNVFSRPRVKRIGGGRWEVFVWKSLLERPQKVHVHGWNVYIYIYVCIDIYIYIYVGFPEIKGPLTFLVSWWFPSKTNQKQSAILRNSHKGLFGLVFPVDP